MAPSGDLAMTPSERVFCLANMKHRNRCNRKQASGIAESDVEGFDEALHEDATCAIAYWGIALSDWSNPFAPGAKDKSQLQAGRQDAERAKVVGAKTEREKAYIEAVGKLYNDFERTPQRKRLIAYRDAMTRIGAITSSIRTTCRRWQGSRRAGPYAHRD
jgi:hypothetical protein